MRFDQNSPALNSERERAANSSQFPIDRAVRGLGRGLPLCRVGRNGVLADRREATAGEKGVEMRQPVLGLTEVAGLVRCVERDKIRLRLVVRAGRRIRIGPVDQVDDARGERSRRQQPERSRGATLLEELEA